MFMASTPAHLTFTFVHSSGRASKSPGYAGETPKIALGGGIK